MKNISVAIDGPSGAGKSTIAKAISKKMGFIYVDTGAMYRAIGLYIYRNKIGSLDKEKITDALKDIKVELLYQNGTQIIILNGENVSEEIRTSIISKYASDVSAIQAVRDFLLELQRNMAESNNVIMDGRDIGTVILPNAEVKIFLTASAEKRAERRYKELIEKSEKVTFEQVLADMIKRDKNDSSRKNAPLKKANDAIQVDTTDLTLNESVDVIRKIIEERFAERVTDEIAKG